MSMCQISDRVQSIYLKHYLIYKMISMFAVITSFPGGGGGYHAMHVDIGMVT